LKIAPGKIRQWRKAGAAESVNWAQGCSTLRLETLAGKPDFPVFCLRDGAALFGILPALSCPRYRLAGLHFGKQRRIKINILQ